ncbi:MAG: hypothetical protein JSS72_04600 [Armatimonadetes bacterium]|nr:hypothetical protein [Armatimonadota bacterium]
MNLNRTAAISIFIVTAAISAAKPPFLKTFMETYKPKPDSLLAKSRCLICHMPPGPPIRNAFGRDVQAALRAAHERMVTPEILKSVELKDSDGDGVKNIDEIKAGTMPGDPKSKPATKPTKPIKKKKKKK